jgi:hypothetical protein
MNVEVEIIKDIPKQQIEKFEDKVVYNTAILTREYTKSANAYPYLTGRLRSSEVSSPVVGVNKEYGLTAGVKYASRVWDYNNVNWTNPSTRPQWYYTTFKNQTNTIVSNAVVRALKEI